jgi:hypothetical protein
MRYIEPDLLDPLEIEHLSRIHWKIYSLVVSLMKKRSVSSVLIFPMAILSRLYCQNRYL